MTSELNLVRILEINQAVCIGVVLRGQNSLSKSESSLGFGEGGGKMICYLGTNSNEGL